MSAVHIVTALIIRSKSSRLTPLTFYCNESGAKSKFCIYTIFFCFIQQVIMARSCNPPFEIPTNILCRKKKSFSQEFCLLFTADE